MTQDKRILTLALEALYLERQRLDGEIAHIKRQLGRTRSTAGGTLSSRPPSRLSAAGRKAISDAMTKRWAHYRRRKALINKA